MIKLLLIIIIFIWPLGQLAGNSLDYLTALLWLLLLFSAPRRRQVFADPLFRPLLIFWISLALSLLVNQTFSLRLLRLIALPSVYFAFKQVRLPRPLYLTPLLAFLILGLSQYLLLPDTRFLKFYGFDDHYYRLLGTLFDPNFTGLIIAQISLIGLSLLPARYRIINLLPLLALALTFSRASYLAYASGLLVLALRRGRLLLLLFFLGFLIWLIPKPFGEGVNLLRTFSIYSRLDSQRFALELFWQRPFFGQGLDLPRGIDDSVLYLLAAGGLSAGFGFLYLLLHLFRYSRASLLLLSILITSLVHSLFNNSFFYLYQQVFFWSILGYFGSWLKKVPTQS